MEFLEILTGPSNRFDAGLMPGHNEIKACRDAVISILGRLEALEEIKRKDVYVEFTKPKKGKK